MLTRYSNYNSNNYYSYNYNGSNNNQTQSYQSNNNGGGLGASYSTSDRNVKVTQSAPTQQSSNHSSAAFSGQTSSGSNLYTSGQCTYYVFDKVGGKIGSTWGNANNWQRSCTRRLHSK